MPLPAEVDDVVGQKIKVGSIVVAPHSTTTVFIGKVTKITPKQLKIEGSGYWRPVYKNHNQVVCMDAIPETVMYILQKDL